MNRFTRIFYGMIAIAISGCGPEADPLLENDPEEEIAFAESELNSPVMLPSTVPFYSEFNPAENPNHYYWCAHGAFKSVYAYKKGAYLNLQTIDWFLTQKYGNYSLCGSLKCSSDAQILGISLTYLGVPNSVIRKVSNVTDFFTKIKDGIAYNYPPIVGSYVSPYGSAGHYWVIVGYLDTGDVNTSKLYLRNVARSSAVYSQYDDIKYVQEFYKSWNSKAGTWFYANDLLFIKP